MTNTINKIMHNGDEFKFDTSSVSGITTTQPSNPSEGAVYYDTTNDVVKVYDGTNWQSIASGGHDYSWETKTITSGAVELGLRTIVEPTSNFTINAPSNIEDGIEYILRVENGSTAYTMTLGNHIDNVHYVDLTLTANGIDTFSFICVDGILEVQPGIVSRDLTSVENGTDLSVVTTGEKYTWDNKQDVITFGDNIYQKGIYTNSKGSMSGNGVIVDFSSRGPSPKGFHIPSRNELEHLKEMMEALNLTSSADWVAKLHLPKGGFRRYSDSYVPAGTGLTRGNTAYRSVTPGTRTYDNYAIYSLIISDSVSITCSSFQRSHGLFIRCFKDVYEAPKSSWTVIEGTLGNAGIFWDQTNGLISITDGTNGYTIMDKNLGATTVYNDGDTLTQANMGNYYQWGNNYGFESSSSTLSNTTSTRVDVSDNGPLNPYSGSSFVTTSSYQDWATSSDRNLWGGETPMYIINTEYIINVSSTAPAVGTANNVITFVIE